MSHLLDSSAWLAHLFAEPGVDEITQLFAAPGTRVKISALSIPEVYGRLRAINQPDQWPAVWGIYGELFARIVPLTEPIAHQAIQLRSQSQHRLPTIDGLIAATALAENDILVHCDPHLSAINNPNLKQLLLPEK